MGVETLIADRAKRMPTSPIRNVLNLALYLEKQGVDVIHFDSGEPARIFQTPEHILEAAKRALDERHIGMTTNRGLLELREAIAKKLREENRIEADPERNIIVTVGESEAMWITFSAILNDGDEVLIPEPIWPHFKALIIACGAKPVSVPTKEEDNFRLLPENLEKSVTRKTKLLVFNSPCNPTGAVYEKSDLAGIADLAKQCNFLVMTDEMYERIIFDDGKHYSIASFPDMAERTLTLNGFSKTYAMTGWRLGYVVADGGLIDQMTKFHQFGVICANYIAQRAAIAALEGPQNCVDMMRKQYHERRDFLVSELNRIEGVSCSNPKGAFYVFPNISRSGLSSSEYAERLLKETGIATVPGIGFGDPGEGFLRIAHTVPMDEITNAVERWSRAAKEGKLRKAPS
jgi:aminotransferase